MIHLETQSAAVADPDGHWIEAVESLIKEARRRKRRRRAGWAGGATVLAALAVGLTVLVSGGGGATPAPSHQPGSARVPFGTCAACTAQSTAASLASAQWVTLPASPLQPRSGQVGLWTGRQLLIWGGASLKSSYRNGATYDPTTKRWKLMPSGPLSSRTNSASVWTGRDVLIWGGFGETTLAGQPVNVPEKGGASYNPMTRTWAKLPNGPLSDRQDPSAVWTGNQMIVFGGQNTADKTLLSAATYAPATKTWAKMPIFPDTRLGGVPVATTSVWNGKQFVVWATFEKRRHLGHYTTEISRRQVMAEWIPGSSHWRTLPQPPTDVATIYATTMWTGTHVVLVNGTDCLPGVSCAPNFAHAPESSYLPDSGKWSAVPQSIVLIGNGPTLWTGRAIVTLNLGTEIGGAKENLSPGQAAAFDPGRKKWIHLPSAPVVGLSSPTDVWTGSSFLVWGQGSKSNQGEALIPKGSPKRRLVHSD